MLIHLIGPIVLLSPSALSSHHQSCCLAQKFAVRRGQTSPAPVMRLRRLSLESAAHLPRVARPAPRCGRSYHLEVAMFDDLYANEQEPEEEQEQEQGENVPELDEYSEEELDNLFDRLEGK